MAIPPAARPRYAYLGPAGTFTEEALRRVINLKQAELLEKVDVLSVIDAVRDGEADHAVVAMESSVEGGVTVVLDALASGPGLVIQREILVPVSFSLAAAAGTSLEQVNAVIAHPVAWAQCRLWMHQNLPQAQHVVAQSSTVAACELQRVQLGATSLADLEYQAAIMPPPAVAQYNLNTLASGIADNASAVTRFVLIGRPGPVPPPTGADKTTLSIALPDERAGALLVLLEQFAIRGINLTRIESRPSGDALGRYVFSVDAEAHVSEPRMAEALVGLHRFSPNVRYLGSYPKANAVPTKLGPGSAGEDYAAAHQWVTQLQAGQSV